MSILNVNKKTIMKSTFLFLLIFSLCGKKEERLTGAQIKGRIKQWARDFSQDLKVEEVKDTLKITIVKGSTSVGVWAYPFKDMYGERDWLVDIFAFVAIGAKFAPELASYLLNLNSKPLSFYVFKYIPYENQPRGDVVCKSFLFGSTLGRVEFKTCLGTVGVLADEYDDEITRRFGGLTILEAAKQKFKKKTLKK